MARKETLYAALLHFTPIYLDAHFDEGNEEQRSKQKNRNACQTSQASESEKVTDGQEGKGHGTEHDAYPQLDEGTGINLAA